MSSTSVTVSGSFDNLERFLQKLQKLDVISLIEPIVQQGVLALHDATPTETGLTAASWSYEIVQTEGELTIYWTNDDIENGFPVAIMLQLGHGTGSGGYVQGRDYINPALTPIFDQITEAVWKAVTTT